MKNAMPEPLIRVSLHTDPALADRISDLLAASGRAVSAWTDADTGAARVDWFAADPAEADTAADTLRTAAAALADGAPWRVTGEPLPREDWAESWKRFFHAERVSPRVIVRPSWEPFPAGPEDCDVVLDAGMCFGTGQHGTTRACIRFLDTLAAEGRTGSLLDAGCGSGILAIAAAKLGFAPVSAFDCDGAAVDQAADNARVNGVAEAIRLETADLFAYTPAAPFDVVAANIEAPVLLAAADRLAERLCAPRPGAALLLAGLLDRQYPEVRAAFQRRGFAERARLTLDDWTSGLFERV